MTRNLSFDEETAMTVPGNLHELVRGEEQGLLDQVKPVVEKGTVTLDLGPIERIDAAGIAALISLYGYARTAGHEFTVTNASPRVVEILSLVGLDRILLNQAPVPCPQNDPCFERPAA
jgi:anti-anti-sigma factor